MLIYMLNQSVLETRDHYFYFLDYDLKLRTIEEINRGNPEKVMVIRLFTT